MFRRALEIEEDLAKKNPVQFEPGLAFTINKYGILCEQQHRFEEAKGLYSRALAIRQKQILEGLTNDVEELGEVYQNLENLRDSFDVRKDYRSAISIQHERAACMDSLRHLGSEYITQAAEDYGILSWYSLFTHDFPAAESAARRALTLDPTQTWVNTNLALALLFQHNNPESKIIYQHFKDETYDPEPRKKFRDVFLEDLETLRDAGVASEQYLEQVKAWIEK